LVLNLTDEQSTIYENSDFDQFLAAGN
jgi:hypothetical protein